MNPVIISVAGGYHINKKCYKSVINIADNYRHSFKIIDEGKNFSLMGNFNGVYSYFYISFNSISKSFIISSISNVIVAQLTIEGNNFFDSEKRILGSVKGDTVILLDKHIKKEFIFELSIT